MALSTGRPGRPEKRGDRRKRSSKCKKGKGVAPEISLADAIQKLPEGNTEQFLVKTGMVRDFMQALGRRDL